MLVNALTVGTGRALVSIQGEEFLQRLHGAQTILNGSWVPAVIVALMDGPRRYAELVESVRSFDLPSSSPEERRVVSETMMTRTLNRMVADGLVARSEETGTFPRSVTYTLLPAARESIDALAPLAEWTVGNTGLISRAQHRRRQQRRSA